MLFALLGAAFAAPIPITADWRCEIVGEMPGPEDFDVVTRDGRPWVLVSADQRRDPSDSTGDGLWWVDPRTGESARAPLVDRDGCATGFHGIATVQDAAGDWQVYVVNHLAEADRDNAACTLPADAPLHSVEHYRVEGDSLRFVERLSTPLFRSPNDVDAHPDGRLVVSDNPDWELPKGALPLLLQTGPSRVLAYAPDAGWSVAAEGLTYANGLLFDPQGQLLVSTFGGHLFRYVPVDDGWRRTGYTRGLEGALDNVMLDPDGRVWVTGHPKTVAFAKHVSDPAVQAPCDVYELRADGPDQVIRRAWRVSGEDIKACSTATIVSDRLVLAQVFEPGIGVCVPAE
ncbi:MAG: SMP-30/gluconolactonase/LRE family protein [Alphaproteobacteria bacterium]|nr:SMP-30/gluconolactonase/LRE family protein [Alphaproteobacteria bacterium]